MVGDMRLAIEAKATARVTSSHLKGLRTLSQEHPSISRRVVVCLESRSRRTNDGVDVIGAPDFVRELWQGELVQRPDPPINNAWGAPDRSPGSFPP